MSIAGELERLRLAAAIESDCILLPSGSICKHYLLSIANSAVSGGDS
jgi:hypothetical protein